MFSGLTRKDFMQALIGGTFMAIAGYAIMVGLLLAFQAPF
jgi:hypothetical protein